MKYTLQDLPTPIRQQVEDYIDFLMEKYQVSLSLQAAFTDVDSDSDQDVSLLTASKASPAD
mgnify:CR=1 FL=1